MRVEIRDGTIMAKFIELHIVNGPLMTVRIDAIVAIKTNPPTNRGAYIVLKGSSDVREIREDYFELKKILLSSEDND
jgi:hypothetical protein